MARMMTSVIIITFNQEEELKRSLPLYLAQKGCDFETIVIDKNSEDGTLAYLEDLEEQGTPQLSHMLLPSTAKGINKDMLALMLGVRHSISKRIILTRPDCIPSSDEWLSNITSAWSADTPLLLLATYPQKAKKKKLSLRQKYALWLLQHGYARRSLGQTAGFDKELFLSHHELAKKSKPTDRTVDLIVRNSSTPTNTTILTDAKYSVYSLVP